MEETILAVSEMLDLSAEYDGMVEGTIIESQMTKKNGIVSTMIVRRGTLKVGDVIVSGTTWCKIKRMLDDSGRVVKIATPSQPVEVFGWKDVPEAGDEVLQAEHEVFK